jgi:hypothetical protein
MVDVIAFNLLISAGLIGLSTVATTQLERPHAKHPCPVAEEDLPTSDDNEDHTTTGTPWTARTTQGSPGNDSDNASRRGNDEDETRRGKTTKHGECTKGHQEPGERRGQSRQLRQHQQKPRG